MSQELFAEVLRAYMQQAQMRPAQLASLTGIPKDTILNWLKLRVIRPRKWQDIVRVAAALHLDRVSTDRLLQAAHHHLVTELIEIAETETDRKLFIPWIEELERTGKHRQLPPREPQFAGREVEVASVMNDMRPSQVVTLCGPGGIGKTAITVEALHRLNDEGKLVVRFPDGVIFHNFYDPSQQKTTVVMEQIARTFGAEPKPTPATAARRVLAGKKVLVILDGTENAEDLPSLLEVLGSCGIVITSRRIKDAPNSNWCSVPPLPLTQSINLLQIWGGKRASDEEIAKEICNLVGSLPLAVRLVGRYLAQTQEEAAEYLAWLREKRLDALDLGQRQSESVPLLLERSKARLSKEARKVLALAGYLAFAPFRQEMVAAAFDQEDDNSIRQGLGELVNWGLLVRPQLTYQVAHALIHTYAREQLTLPVGVLEHLTNYLTTTIYKESKRGMEGYILLDHMRVHVLALLDGLQRESRWQAIINLVTEVDSYLDHQGHWIDRQRAIQLCIIALNNQGKGSEKIMWLAKLGNTYRYLGQTQLALRSHEEALKIAKEYDDKYGIGVAYGSLGLVYRDLGQVERAIIYHKKALRTARELKDSHNERAALDNLGNAYRFQGDMEKSIEYHTQALNVAREIGDKRAEGAALGSLGLAYRYLWHTDKAIECHLQALFIAQEIGDRRGESAALGSLGMVYRYVDDLQSAIDCHEKALAISRDIGDKHGEGIALGNLGQAYRKLKQYEKAISSHEKSLEIAQEIDDRRGEGGALGSLSLVYRELGQSELAIEYGAESLRIRSEIGDKWGEAATLNNIGLAHRDLGNTEQALHYGKQAAELYRELDAPNLVEVESWMESLSASDAEY